MIVDNIAYVAVQTQSQYRCMPMSGIEGPTKTIC